MEAVKVFNTELSSLYESKPPVSRAKMASITKTALKAVKFYKHVVQSVEKFILKCRPEYKVSGLYVIDSIVRQSRHQFGADKDVFAQRFAKNIHTTFQHLLQGAPNDKEKIVRVVHLWQKNNVFPQEILQSLLQLDDSGGISSRLSGAQQDHSETVNSTSVAETSAVTVTVTMPGPVPAPQSASVAPSSTLLSTVKDSKPSQSASDIETSLSSLAAQLGAIGAGSENLQTDVLSAFVQLLQTQAGLQSMSQPAVSATLQSSAPPAPVTQPEQSVTEVPVPQPAAVLSQYSSLTSAVEPAFNKKLLAFDYGESDDEDASKPVGASHTQQHQAVTRQQTEHQPPHLVPVFQQQQQQVVMEGQVQQPAPAMPLMQPPHTIHHQSRAPFYPHNQQNPATEMINTFPPQQSEYHGVIPEDRQIPAGVYIDPSIPREHSQMPELQQRDVYSNGDGERWPVSGRDRHEGSPNTSFRSQYSGYDKTSGSDSMMWHSQQNEVQPYPPLTGQVSQPYSGRTGSYDDSLAAAEDQENYEYVRQMDEFGEPTRERRRERDRDRDSDSRRHRSNDRSPQRRRDRQDLSRHSRDNRDRRRHSRDRDTHRRRRSRSHSSSRDLERTKYERARDRRLKGLPPFKEEHLIICSKTLWIGRLNKHTTEQELSSELSQFGEISSINLIPPRGCAYVCFALRRDAARALDRLKGYKLNGNMLKVAWALDVGVKQSEFKDLWDVELGATYIPWSKVPDNLEQLADGAFIDDESLPESVRKAMAEASRRQIESEAAAAKSVDVLPSATDAGTELQPAAADAVTASAADSADGAAGAGDSGETVVPAAPLPGPMMPPGMMPPHMIPGMMGMMPMMRPPGMMPAMMPPPPGVAVPPFRPPSSQDDQSSGAESSPSSVNWPAPPLPGAYPWPTPPPMSVMPPMGVRPPMMFGPPPAGFPAGRFMLPGRMPLSAGQEAAGKENEETGADGDVGQSERSDDKSAQESLHHAADNVISVAHMGNFPRPMGCGDWRMRGPPPPFMHGPNMLRPDMMRGPPSLLGEGPGPRGFPGVPPAGFGMAPNIPTVGEEEDGEYGEEYGEEEEEDGEYGEEEEGNEEEWNEEGNEEEEYNEECEEFPYDENGEEEFGQGSDCFRGRQREAYFPRFRGRGPRMGRGGNRWHDGVTHRLLAPRFGNMQRFERPGRFEGPPRFTGRHRFNGPPRFDGPGSNRFNVPRFDGPPVFMRGGPPVDLLNMQLEGPFRGGPDMGPRFRGPIPAGGVQPLFNLPHPPWNDDNSMENEEDMENEGFEVTGGGEPTFDVGRPSWTDSPEIETEQKMHKGSGDVSNKAEHVEVKSDNESKTTALPSENNSSSADTSTAGEKRVRKSRWSSVPPESTERQLSSESRDSTKEPTESVITSEPADSTLNPETEKTDSV